MDTMKIASIIAIAALIVNMLLFAFGYYDALRFWIVLGATAAISYPLWKKR